MTYANLTIRSKRSEVTDAVAAGEDFAENDLGSTVLAPGKPTHVIGID
jgi:hypothetical protein